MRWYDKKTKLRKYKDWKVKVLRYHEDRPFPGEPFCYDYVVVHKLPCTLDEIEKHLKTKGVLTVHHSKYLSPAPIRGITWKFTPRNSKKVVTVNSQMYYDIPNFKRFKFDKARKMYLN